MVKKIVVGAHYGLSGWLVQRISAIVMLVYTVIMIFVLCSYTTELNYSNWKTLMSFHSTRILTFVFFTSLLLHAWVGMRDILMDYIKPTGLRLTLHVFVILALVCYAGWTIQILWKS